MSSRTGRPIERVTGVPGGPASLYEGDTTMTKFVAGAVAVALLASAMAMAVVTESQAYTCTSTRVGNSVVTRCF
jgi:hypothetical protein